MKRILLLPLVLLSLFASSQSIFFKSSQSFTKKQLGSFYSSINLQGNLLLFNASDYRLYAYDVSSGQLKWETLLDWKSNLPPRLVQGTVWANAENNVIQLDTASGEKIRDIKFGELQSEPLIKDGILFGTGIYDIGCVFAYDLKADSLIWTRFIAHGCTTRPYYFDNSILANGEGGHWLEMDYAGRLTDPACETEEQVFPSELACIKKFAFLTHDRLPLNEKLAKKMNPEYNEVDYLYTDGYTLALSEGRLYAIGNKQKLKAEIDLVALSDTLEFGMTSSDKILKAEGDHVWVLAGNYLLNLDFKKKKLTAAIDLKEWEPHQAILQDDRLWLISGKDGLLYGMKLEPMSSLQK